MGSTITKHFEKLVAVITLLILVVPVFIIGIKILSSRRLEVNKMSYVILSKRSPVQDLEIVNVSRAHSSLIYYRFDDPNAKTFKKFLPALSPGEDIWLVGIHELQVGKVLVGTQATHFLQGYLTTLRFSDIPVGIPICCLVGVLLGSLLPFPLKSLTAISVLLVALSLVKLLTTCVTCAEVRLLGMDPAGAGILYFGAMTAGFIALRGEQAKRWLWFGFIPVIAWQLTQSVSMHDNCLVCSTISLILAATVASGMQFTVHAGNASEERPIQTIKLRSIWASTLMVPAILLLIISRTQGSLITDSKSVSRMSAFLPTRVRTIAELGLKAPGKREVLYVGHSGCRACMVGLDAMDATHLMGVTFGYVGAIPPDTRRPWLQIPNESSISVTPSVLFIAEDGTVTDETYGFGTLPYQVMEFQTKVANFMTARA